MLARPQALAGNPKHHKLGQHIKYDRHVFANHGIEVQGYAHDTMLQSYVLEVHKPHNLTSLAERHTGRKGISYEDLCGKGAQPDPVCASARGQSRRLLVRRLRPDPGRTQRPVAPAAADDKLRFIYELEIASSEALYRIERNGVLIDAPTLAAQSHELGQRILQLETEAYEIAGQPFNLSSPKQLGEIFFDKLGMPVIRSTPPVPAAPTKKCWKSWPRTTPARQAAGAPQPGQAQRHLHRQARPAGPATHRPRAHALRAGRGRDRPLVQQRPQPAEHPRAKPPKAAACARPSWPPQAASIASADYSQIELRIMATPQRRPLAAARLPRRAGRAPRHRCRSVSGGGRSGHQRATPLRQGHQLWPPSTA